MLRRRRLAVLLAAVMMLVIAASPAWADFGGNQKGVGRGFGGGDIINSQDNGKHTATGGGSKHNNPHSSC